MEAMWCLQETRPEGRENEELAMPGLPAALVRHRERLDEIGEVLAKYGFAAWVQRGSGLVSARIVKGLVDHYVDPEVVAMSDGERLRRGGARCGATRGGYRARVVRSPGGV